MDDNEPERIYEAACRLVRQGISVIPTGGGVSVRAKEPHTQALIASGHTFTNDDGELRASWKPLQTQLPTAQDLQTWYLHSRARGLAVVTGELSGYVVIDVDLMGLPLLHKLGWKPHVVSPSGGAHLYLHHPGWFVPSNASKSKRTLPPGFDVRGDGGYIMFPPSRNREGFYRRTDERRRLSVWDIPEAISVAGETYHLREALGLTPPAPQDSRPAERPDVQPFDADDERCPMALLLDRAADYALESRNKGAFMLGLWAHANDYSRDEAIHAAGEYTDIVQGVKRTPFTLDEARKAVASAYTYPKKDRWQKREELFL
ncbi:bifunctional DNA primase/polymerase [Deinococcus humi]|uniref:DNA primase/polymerase bifunctional N-terminal domain-containing protein n=1 Tax=Deinococcus humi TaxID=662880 RepID=A0A7W8K016_9DEIO|nr:bifunctional DNA primase/polymerase [Deinococcus humi]MBB5366304.1 hypothetical protein [Deinococcus humi]